jgi:hypothetical protein
MASDSLGSSAKTLMIVQSSPLAKDIPESVCSLQVTLPCLLYIYTEREREREREKREREERERERRERDTYR